MKRSRSALLRFFYLVFLLTKHLGGYVIYSLLRRIRVARPSSGGGVWSDLSRPARVRLFFQEVDGAFIKLGQILAMRVEFLPEEYTQELLKLLDEVPPFDPLVARSIIESDLRGNIDQLFRSFQTEPFAAASFGQVHFAILPDGEAVVVKVRRPSVAATIEADLKLFRLAAFFVDAIGVTKRTPLRPVYQDFAVWTREELDYKIEGSHIQELYEKSKGSAKERVPKVYWSHTSKRVLTLERLYGVWVKEILKGLQVDREAVIGELSARNTNLTEVSQNLFRNTLRQIFVYGFFHADPHAANLLIMNDGVIGYVDFGITGRIGERDKETQVNIHVALESGDFEEFYLAMLETIAPPQGADLTKFRGALERAYTDWLTAQYMTHGHIREKSFARLMLRINNAAQRYGLGFKKVEVRIFRTLATVDAVILQFDPTLDVRSEFRHFFGAFKAFNVVADKIPTLMHKLPQLLDMLSQRLDDLVVVPIVRVNKFRRGLGVLFQLLSVVAAAGVILMFVPAVSRSILTAAGLGRSAMVLLLVLGVAIFAWLGYLLKLRSVVHDTIIEHRRCHPSAERSRDVVTNLNV